MNAEWKKKGFKLLKSITMVLVAPMFVLGAVQAQAGQMASLKTVAVPEPPNLAEYIVDKGAVIRLGKALFWDMQVGADGVQACASCHFHAGADNRAKNQLSPSLLRLTPDLASSDPDTTFQIGGPNYTLTAADFPFTRFADPDERATRMGDGANDVASSQGVFRTNFVNTPAPGRSVDVCSHVADTVFNVGGIDTRRVEPRNTPSAINAIFNFRNFWDARAQFEFNGVNPFGTRDPNARIFKVVNNKLTQVPIAIKFASLASQAVGPPRSFFEMSCDGRAFAHIGKKLLDPNIIPLGKQLVHPDDSVLGPIARSRISSSFKGLQKSYATLIKGAFRPEYWNSSTLVPLNPASELSSDLLRGSNTPGATTQFTQMQANFALFFGLAVQLYEATLVSDETPADKFLGDANTPPDPTALTERQQLGKTLFEGKGLCSNCHGGAELTNASVTNVMNETLERMTMGDGGIAVYDNGFYNIGVRPTREDLGGGGKDPFGNPLSETRFCQERVGTVNPCQPEITDIVARPLEGIPAGELQADERIAVNGAFKTPNLRDQLLMGPYFHNGGQATLRQVVDAYNRGQDFHEENIDDLDPAIQKLGLTDEEKTALVDFLACGLLDPRVRYKRAPFDHPELFIPNGHPGSTTSVTNNGKGEATDSLLRIPAVGRDGVTTPLAPFLDLDPDPFVNRSCSG